MAKRLALMLLEGNDGTWPNIATLGEREERATGINPARKARYKMTSPLFSL